MGSSQATSRRRLIQGMCAVAAVAGAIFLLRAFRDPPQIGAGEEAFTTVDALFTALTSRDESRLEDCAARLDELRDEDQLPAPAADFLDTVIDQARAGQWEPAAKRLYDFMYGQRRASP